MQHLIGVLSAFAFAGVMVLFAQPKQTRYEVVCRDTTTFTITPGYVSDEDDLKKDEDRECRATKHQGLKSLKKIESFAK